MAGNGNGTSGTRSFDERFAALDERVTNLRSSLTNLEHSISRGFSQIDQKLAEQASAIANTQRTPWSTIWTALGVLCAAMVAIGGLAYWPIQASVSDLKAGEAKISGTFAELPRIYLSNDVAQILRDRAAEDRKLMQEQLGELQGKKLAVDEWKLRNDTVDRLIADLSARITANTAEINMVNGGLPDLVRDMKARIERLENK